MANLLTNTEAAEYLGIKPQTLEKWRSTRSVNIPYVVVGTRNIRYKETDLLEYLERNHKQYDYFLAGA